MLRVARAIVRRLSAVGAGARTGDARASHRRAAPVGPGPHCLVCSAQRPEFQSLTFHKSDDLVREFATCPACRYVQIKELSSNKYRGATDITELAGGGGRIGTLDQPGREFHMARFGLDVLGRSGVDAMIYGIGRSLDNHHVAKLKRVRHVAIGDIMRLRDDAEFHDANLPATRTFDLVIASEVIEHFRTPHEDFAKLFQFVGDDGLLVCGTNISAGHDLTKDRYPFYEDHTSFYSPRALALIAAEHGFLLDFRTPERAGAKGRKRYVLFTRSERVRSRWVAYFGTKTFAPSEVFEPAS